MNGSTEAPGVTTGDAPAAAAVSNGAAATADSTAGSAGVASAPVSTTAKCEEYTTNVQYPLKRCDTGYVVTLVQQVLKNFGYYDGPISGNFDSATEESLCAYQDAMELVVDGEVGSQTWGRSPSARRIDTTLAAVARGTGHRQNP